MKAVLNKARVTAVAAFVVAAAVLAPLPFWLFRPDSTVVATQMQEQAAAFSKYKNEAARFGFTGASYLREGSW